MKTFAKRLQDLLLNEESLSSFLEEVGFKYCNLKSLKGYLDLNTTKNSELKQ